MNNKYLRNGYTTGSCAAAAAKAAIIMLLGGEMIDEVHLLTPNQTNLHLEVEDGVKTLTWASCGIRKDAGDDPDVTHGILVYARVNRHDHEPGITIDGGTGVGRVTRKGLQQEIGGAAINKVPSAMILKEAEALCREYSYQGGLEIIISIPAGAALAENTFNPRLGITGGISVLGTTGIVEPMSEKALTDTIHVELKFMKANGHEYCYVVPGNYGSDFLTGEMQFSMDDAVKCSNYIGETIESALQLGLKGILFVGHIGKFVKLAAGIMNTHSKMADARMEILGVHAALAGAQTDTVKAIMGCVTTAEALDILELRGLRTLTMESIMGKIEDHLQHKTMGRLEIGAVVFSENYGILGQTSKAAGIMRKCQERNQL